MPTSGTSSAAAGGSAAAAAAVGAVAAAVLGPGGGHVVIAANESDGAAGGTATSSGGRLAALLRVDAPASRLLLDGSARAQAARWGDGSSLCLLVAAHLCEAALRAGEERGRAELLRALRGHARALSWCREALQPVPLAQQQARQKQLAQQRSTCLRGGTPGCSSGHPPGSAASARAAHACVEGAGEHASSGAGARETRAPSPQMPLLCELRLRGTAELLALARAALAPKRLAGLGNGSDDGGALEHVAVLVVQAFVGSIADVSAGGGGRWAGACVRPVAVAGASPHDCACLVDAIVLDKVAAPTYQARLSLEALGKRLEARAARADAHAHAHAHARSGSLPAEPVCASVALFTCALGGARIAARHAEDEELPAAAVACAASQADAAAMDSELLERFEALAAAVQTAGIELLICQRTIHPLLQEVLLARGVAPLERVAARHVNAIARLTGSIAIASEAAVWEAPMLPSAGEEESVKPRVRAARALRHAAGVVGALAVRRVIGVQRAVVMRPPSRDLAALHAAQRRAFGEARIPDSAPVSTLLLCAADQCAAEELAEAAMQCARSLQHAVSRPRAVPGGGYAEAALAHAVRMRAAAERETCLARVAAEQLTGEGGALGARTGAERARRARIAARADEGAAVQLAEALETAVAAIARGCACARADSGCALEGSEAATDNAAGNVLAGMGLGAREIVRANTHWEAADAANACVTLRAALAGRAALPPVATLERAAAAGDVGGCCWRVREAQLLDLADAKLSALELAVEVAAVAARVETLIPGCDV